jgi:polyketide cyclase/dehydrase/lipid transport protein
MIRPGAALCFGALVAASCGQVESGGTQMTSPSVRHVSVTINRSAAEVYEFASNPENLPQWASGLAGSISKVNGEWVSDSPMGRVKIKFAEKNSFGVLDHDVTLPAGATVHNPMRVVPKGNGSEVIFTLFRQPDVTDKKFAEDAAWVEKDLKKLKAVLEK